MMKITWVSYKDKEGYIRDKQYIKYVAENGNFICTIDGVIVSRKEGLEDFFHIKNSLQVLSIKSTEMQKTNEEIIEWLKSGIDRFTCYIDNYWQEQAAKANNDRIRRVIKAFEEVANE